MALEKKGNASRKWGNACIHEWLKP